MQKNVHTVCPRNFPPDDTNLRASDFSLCAVDVGDFLAKVEAEAHISMIR